MKEERYITLYMSKPSWYNGRWIAYTSENPGKPYPYRIDVPVPADLLAEVIEPLPTIMTTEI